MSWLRERVESKTGRTVPLPPRNQPWLPSVLVQVAPAVVSALTYAVIDERDQPDGLLSFVLSGGRAWTTWGGCDIGTIGWSGLRSRRVIGR
jgi:hypothetical protein